MKKQIIQGCISHRISHAFSFALLLLLISIAGQSQNSFVKMVAIGDSVFSIEATKVVNRPMNVKVCAGGLINEKCRQFDFYAESYSVFQKLLFKSIMELLSKPPEDKTLNDSLRLLISFVAGDIYRDLMLFQIDGNEEVPIAGYLKFYKTVIVEPNIIGRMPCSKNRRIDTLKLIVDTNMLLLGKLKTRIDSLNVGRQSPISRKFFIASYEQKMAALQTKLLDYKLTEKRIRKNFSGIIGEIVRDSSTVALIHALNTIQEQEPGKVSPSVAEKNAAEAKRLLTAAKLPYPEPQRVRFYIDKMVLQYYGKTTPTDFKRKFLKSEIFAEKAMKQRLDSMIALGDKLICLSVEIDSLEKQETKLTEEMGAGLKENAMQISLTADSLKNQLKPAEKAYAQLNNQFSEKFDLFLTTHKTFKNLENSPGNIQDNYDSLIRVVNSLDKCVADILPLLKGMEATLDQRIADIQRNTIKSEAIAKQVITKQEQVVQLMKTAKSDTLTNPATLKHKLDSLRNLNDTLKASLSEIKGDVERLNDSLRKLQVLKKDVMTSLMLVNDCVKSLDGFKQYVCSYQAGKRELEELDAKKEKLDNDLAFLLRSPVIKVDSVHVEFNDGVLKNIVVEGKYGDCELIFTNSEPVQFTGITHLEKLDKVELVDMYTRSYKIRLIDVMKYVPVLHVDAEDYSPSDSVYNSKIGMEGSVVQPAFKEKKSQILEARAFSDLVGLNAQQPNGLLQFEVCKKIPLFTHRIKYSRKYRSFVSFGSFYYPQFTLSKLEQNNKYYYVENLDTNLGKGKISTLDIYKFSSIKMKLLYINIFNWEIAEVKSAVEINGGFTLLYTPMRDSITKKGTTTQWGSVSGMPFTELKFLLKPDVRYGFSISGGVGWIFNWDNKLLQVNDPSDPAESSKLLFTFQFDSFYKPFRRSENAIFFRVANMHTWPFNATYLQVQLGYAFNIFKSSASGKK